MSHAIGMAELSSIAAGFSVQDAMLKAAAVDLILARTICSGKFVIIVGAPTSANSNSLRSVAESVGAKSYIVDNASELNPDWFVGVENIAISSGASTPEDILNQVIEKIKEITRQ